MITRPEDLNIPEDFPRWKDENCPHLLERQRLDGMGLICLDCGILTVLWRV